MTAGTATWHKGACILCENNCGIQIQTDGRRFAKIRGDKEHVAIAGYTCNKALRLIRAARTDGQTFAAEGTVIHAGRRTATAEGKVLDDQGKLIAHATTTCMILWVARRGRLHLP
ncbi:hypothetical protein [Streptomyces sp. 2A115]|uniref:hypothetical protein n=1 Tax=Streptomyces sp. 2A115 TaxID=3457439 RepID=UPI003FD203C2